MVKRLSLILAIMTVLLFGCQESRLTESIGSSERLDSSAWMMEYLENQNLPALKSVEHWENEYGEGLRLTTAHYEILTTLLEPLMLTQIPGFVESCYSSYNKQLPKPMDTKTKLLVYLFSTRKQWEDFTKKFTGRQAEMYCKIKAGAYYLNGACVAYNIGRERTFSVLGHEGWHQFNSRLFKYRLPSWLDEGIAMLFEASRYDKGMFYFEPARNLNRLGALKTTLMKNKMIPLEKLITLNPGEVLATNQDDAVIAFYSQSYALVRFLREDGYGRRLSNYHQMLMDGLDGRWSLNEKLKTVAADRNIPLTVGWNRIVGKKLFEEYIGDDFTALNDEYVRFCRKIVYPVHLK